MVQTLQQDSVLTTRPRPGGCTAVGVLSIGPGPQLDTTALSEIQRAAGDRDCLVTTVRIPAGDRHLLRGALERLRRQGVDGVLVIAPHSDTAEVLVKAARGLPLVAIGAGPQELLPAVCAEDHAGGAAVTRHLLGMGHRTVFHIAAAGGLDGERRLAGWRDTLLAAGVEPPAPLMGDGTAEAGYALVRRLVHRRDLTAIFAATDRMALGAVRALADAGLRVPSEVSVAGFGDIPGGQFFSPPLTTVRRDHAALGLHGLQLLQRQIDGDSRARCQVTIPARLIVRASTGVPRGAL